MSTTRLTTTNGVTFITKSNDFFVSKSLEVYGEWSFGEIELLAQILTKSENIVEAGANIGAHTVFLAKDIRWGACGSVMDFSNHADLNHRCELQYVPNDQVVSMMRQFFIDQKKR